MCEKVPILRGIYLYINLNSPLLFFCLICDLESFAFKPGSCQIQVFLLSIVLLGIMKYYIIIKSKTSASAAWLGSGGLIQALQINVDYLEMLSILF